MAKEVEQLVTDTIESLKTKLYEKKSLTVNDATNIIRKCLQKTFSEVSEADHKKLYLKLSLQLHQDKLQHLQREIHDCLKPIDAGQILQQILNEYQEYREFQQYSPKTNFFQNAAADPLNGMKIFIFHILNKLVPMYFTYERYDQPWQLMIFVANWTITIGLAIAAATLILPLAGIYFAVILPLLKLEKLFINSITNSKFDEKIDAFEKDPQRQAQAAHNELNMTRLTRQTTCNYTNRDPINAAYFANMTDEDVFNLLVQAKVIEMVAQAFPGERRPTIEEEQTIRDDCAREIKDSLKSQVKKPSGFDKIALIAQSLGYAIAKPLSDSAGFAAIETIFLKPLLVLYTPVILAASVFIELANYLNTLLGFIVIGVATGIKIATMAIYNTPLYIKDAIGYLKDLCKDNGDKNNLNEESPGDDGIKSPMIPLHKGKADSKIAQQEPVEQSHHNNLFPKQPSLPPTSPQDISPQFSM